VPTPRPPAAASVQAAIPSVDRLLRHPTAQEAIVRAGRTLVVAALRDVTEQLRAALAKGDALPSAFDEASLVRKAVAWADAQSSASLKPVFNLTGTVLHTNLGRALLPDVAVNAVTAVMTRACTLEYALDGGQRGERDEHVEALICRLTGAQAATVVNNNAAAVLLCLSALAAGREVIVSRGELVEIGGAFRIPDVMQSAGCLLREVGTTNRTHLRDYEHVINDATAALMKVHPSNYAIVGFSRSVTEAELAPIAKARNLPLITDLGSGSLVDMVALGLPAEPTPSQMLSAGADIVTFSGDKLLGGPQCGFIVGRADLIERIRRHPLKRALRLDKMTLAALHAVLTLYLDPETLVQRLPTLRMLTRQRSSMQAQGERMLARVSDLLHGIATVDLADCESQIGSGSLPVDRLPSVALRLRPLVGEPVQALAAKLRQTTVPLIGRIHADCLWLDLRCLEQDEEFLAQIAQLSLMGAQSGPSSLKTVPGSAEAALSGTPGGKTLGVGQSQTLIQQDGTQQAHALRAEAVRADASEAVGRQAVCQQAETPEAIPKNVAPNQDGLQRSEPA
jgi:L-seryl-tRNA(Ser) seleniumtransferase